MDVNDFVFAMNTVKTRQTVCYSNKFFLDGAPAFVFRSVNRLKDGAAKGSFCDKDFQTNRFLFEMDNTPLKEQVMLFAKLERFFETIVFSGNKSVHGVINTGLQFGDNYKYVHQRLNALLFDNKADAATSNAGRFTRAAGGLRLSKDNQSVEQELYFIDSTGAGVKNIMPIAVSIMQEISKQNSTKQEKPIFYTPSLYNASAPIRSDIKKIIENIQAGGGSFDEATHVAGYLKIRGFSDEEICEMLRVDEYQDSWNIRRLLSKKSHFLNCS